MSSRRDGEPPPRAMLLPKPPAWLMRMPSTRMIGSLDCEMLALPRIRMRAPSPVIPLDGRPTSPGSRPWITSETVRTGAFSGGFTIAIVLPSRLVSTAPPVPVVTTGVELQRRGAQLEGHARGLAGHGGHRARLRRVADEARPQLERARGRAHDAELAGRVVRRAERRAHDDHLDRLERAPAHGLGDAPLDRRGAGRGGLGEEGGGRTDGGRRGRHQCENERRADDGAHAPSRPDRWTATRISDGGLEPPAVPARRKSVSSVPRGACQSRAAARGARRRARA
jgi:hypothetical protein